VGEKKRNESSLATTSDEKTLYFVSDQKGGIGGKDIYKSIKQLDGTWGAAENLGSIVNTDLDEESPFFDSNNGILYFSSQGHNSMGGFDVYKTKFDNDVWLKPQNMGYPINSGTDDVFYSFDSEQNKGVMSSMRDDAVGNYDIYLVRNIKPLQVLFATTFSNSLMPIEKDFEIFNSKGEKVSSLSSNTISVINFSSAEKFKIRIPHYDSLNVFNEFKFETPESFGDYSYYQEVNYDVVKNPKGQLIGYKTTLYNAFFDVEKEIKKEIELSKMVNKQQAYSVFVKSLLSENKYFQIFSQINYIDTANYLIQEEEMAARALAEGILGQNCLATNGAGNKIAKDVALKKEQVVVSESAAFKTILFHFSKISLSSEAKDEVKNIAEYLKQNKDVKMEIVGYTDSKGESKFNRELSKKRADVIKGMLVKKGINASRLKTKGFGEKNPVSANKNEDNSDNLEGRKLNRRVELLIVAEK
jgi:outer membrane protein OmpA-like peptidoglycan-associated protein